MARAAWKFLLLALFFAAWIAWMVAGRISLSELSQQARLEERGGRFTMVAAFDPATGPGSIHIGQEAWVELTAFPGARYGKIPAHVTNILEQAGSDLLIVEAVLSPAANLPASLRPGMSGTLEVIIEESSPAALLLRAVGGAADRQ